MPAYQARETLPRILEAIEGSADAVIVVDDGSTDGSAEFLRAWASAAGAAASGARRVILRPRNGGKAAALRDGFDVAIARGFDLALTVDADGQHDPADAAAMARRARSRGRADILLCGARDPSTPGYPRRNLSGRRLNDLAIRAQTGVRVVDSPCGLRVYPLETVRLVRCLSGRFAWEEEFLTRAIWAGAIYESMPIRCIYEVGGARRSHYRFRRDWPEGVAINLWLCMLALRPPWPTRRSLERFAWQIGAALSPRRMMDQLRGDAPSRLHGAASAAIGAALLGAWGMPGVSSRAAWIASAVAAWTMIRLHGSMGLAVGGGVAAALLARLPVAPIITALAILLVASSRVLRRRDS